MQTLKKEENKMETSEKALFPFQKGCIWYILIHMLVCILKGWPRTAALPGGPRRGAGPPTGSKLLCTGCRGWKYKRHGVPWQGKSQNLKWYIKARKEVVVNVCLLLP